LLLLPRFDVVRPYHLQTVRPWGLGLVAAGCPTLGYSTLEHFLGDLEALRVAAPLGDALAKQYLEIWPVPEEGGFFYLDNHRKVRYSGYPTAAGKISASDRILGGTTQLFLHDTAGHGLHMHSGPADDHMTRTALPLVQRFISLVGRDKIRGIVADQEIRSVALFQELETMDHLGFVTSSRTPTVKQEANFEIEGLFVPYLRDPESDETTHWLAYAHTRLQDRRQGLSFPAEVTLVVDCRAGMPGRLIPIVHNLRGQDVPVELPHQLYVGHWQGQERVFRDMRPCQNLDAHYGQKKIAVANRRQIRKGEYLRRNLQSLAKQVETAKRKVQEYTERVEVLKQEAQRKKAENKEQVAALRKSGRGAETDRQRERLVIQAERLAAKGQVQQIRLQDRQRRQTTHQRDWQNKLEERQRKRRQVLQELQEMEDRPFYDFDLEKDDLMTYLRMAGENAHRFGQERFFGGSLLEKMDEATMVRLVYNQPGWIRQQGQYLHVLLQGYDNADIQAAVAQACQRVNQAQIELVSGHRLHMEVASES
jgi:phosphopantetheine adenylyltransferase